MSPRAIVTAGVLIALVAAACGKTSHSKTAAVTSTGQLPRTAELVCGRKGTELRTPQVQPRPNGVRVRVRNETEHAVMLDFQIGKDGEGGGGGAEAPPGSSVQLLPFATDRVRISCEARRPFHPADYETIRVVDRKGVLHEAQLECAQEAGTTMFSRPQRAVTARTPLAAARRELQRRGLRAGDKLESAIAVAPEERVIRAVRKGHVVAVVHLDPDRTRAGNWWIVSSVDSCGELRRR